MTKEDYKFYVPYVGTILILLGATKLTIYYSFFDLKITPYLEFTEILTLFLDDLLHFIAIIFIQNWFMFLIQSNRELESISQGLQGALTESNFPKRILSYATNGINLLLLTLIWIVGVPFWLWLSDQTFKTYLYGLYSILIALFLLTVIYETRRQWYIKFDQYPKMVYTNLAKIFIVLLGLTIFSAYGEFESVKKNKKYLGTTLHLSDDRNVVSDSSYYFIGKTRNFVFFHNEKKKRTMSIQ